MLNQTGAPGPATQSDLHAANYRASRALVTPERLREFFAPQSIAMVGASDNSGWARFIVASCATTGFAGRLIPVHPTATTAFGMPVIPNLRNLDEPVDMAFILAPVSAVESVLDDMGAMGIHNAVVLASGYREVGTDGVALEDQMVARAVANDITVLGPNCLGFLNAHAKTAPYALGVPPPLTAGPVGIALQSGALASVVLAFARAHGIGVSTLTSMGNECMMSTIDVLEYLIEDENTKVICLFLEEISDPVKFARAAAKADAAGKPIVALKVGSSPAGQAAALAHTGSVVGDDAVVDAALRQLNVIRVTSVEDLLSTGAVLGYNRWPSGRRMGVVTASGGACDIIADMSSAQGFEIPEFSQHTIDEISKHIPPFATAHNPLDVTGFGLANTRDRSAMSAIDHAMDIAAEDPNLDFVLFAGVNLPDARPPDETMASQMEERMGWLAQRMQSTPIPVIPIGSTCVDNSPYAREQLNKHHINVLGGLGLGISALGNAVRWLENRGKVQPVAQSTVAAIAAPSSAGPWSEAAARDLLSAHGVPIVPGGLATTADEAVEIAVKIGMPVALKICSAQITHKSDIGGVALGLSTEADVRAAFEKVRSSADAVPAATVDGVLVTAMRPGGVEVLAGITVDPTFGPTLAVGLGGIFVEVLKDVSLRVLPVDEAEVKHMLGELRGLPLLQGARGTVPANLDAIAAAVTKISNAALSLGDALGALEVNPLWVNGDQVEALDVLVVTEPAGTSGLEQVA